MTDLEITKLCAEAMGLCGHPVREGMEMWTKEGWGNNKDAIVLHHSCWRIWNPLHDDAQAMALVKKLDLEIHRPWGGWMVVPVVYQRRAMELHSSDHSLNRAICECVAEMQKVK